MVKLDTISILEDNASKGLDIGEFVQNTTWRELLIEMVDTKKLDPWDINITEMVEGYIELIMKMQKLDLRLPANIILAASILLRMKSESLEIFSMSDENDEVPPELPARQNVDIPALLLKSRQQPHKRITLQELLDALDSAMKSEEKRKISRSVMEAPINIIIGNDIDERIEETYRLLISKSDKFGMTTFNFLVNEFHTNEERLLNLFIPLLFLFQKNKINLIQEEFFGELVIIVNKA